MMLLEVRNLVKTFARSTRRGGAAVAAVDDVSFELAEGETLALVGESGAGKSTTGRLVLRLIEPDGGSIRFDDQDLCSLRGEEMRRARQRLQMVFQDPYGCLDPRITIGASVTEPLVVHFKAMGKGERRDRAVDTLERVGLGARFFDRLPHELSGGQLQRVAIARSLTLNPKLIVCDEPVAALDVSVRAQVLNLLSDLQKELGIAYLFISHDLALVEVFADRVAVMRNGRIVETGTAEGIFRSPQSEYTRELLRAIPLITEPRPGATSLTGDLAR
jgi:ABC-type glutathione transport system ATPase component